MEDYNTVHPRARLGYRSPREYIATQPTRCVSGLIRVNSTPSLPKMSPTIVGTRDRQSTIAYAILARLVHNARNPKSLCE